MPEPPVIKPAPEYLWAPMWRQDLWDFSYLLPRERQVWEVARRTWLVDLSETFGMELPYGFIGSQKHPYVLFPSNIAFHTGIGPPDELEADVQGKEFLMNLTQIRIPLIYLHKELPLVPFRTIVGTLSGPVPIPGQVREIFELAQERRLTFFLLEPYADSDTASKYLTILYWLKRWEYKIGYKVNIHTSRILCFHADQGIEKSMRRKIKLFEWEFVPRYENLVWEFNPGKDYYKLQERYERSPTEPLPEI